MSPPEGPKRHDSGAVLAAVQSHTANAARELAESAVRDRFGMVLPGVWVKLIRTPGGLPPSRGLAAGQVAQTVAPPENWPPATGTACVTGRDGVVVRLLRGEFEVVS